jgi:hypothetical protein
MLMRQKLLLIAARDDLKKRTLCWREPFQAARARTLPSTDFSWLTSASSREGSALKGSTMHMHIF